jgi:uncharacterized protein YjbJ (UPF0337 family)
MINKDRIKGSAEQAKGKVKEWAGKVTGDKKTETEGKAEELKGKVRSAVGGIKDAARGQVTSGPLWLSPLVLARPSAIAGPAGRRHRRDSALRLHRRMAQ